MDIMTYALCKKLIGESAAASSKIGFKKVDVLPEVGEQNYIYLVPKAKTLTQNVLDEYIWIDNKWELIGSVEVDLTEYAKLSDLPTITNKAATNQFIQVNDVDTEGKPLNFKSVTIPGAEGTNF